MYKAKRLYLFVIPFIFGVVLFLCSCSKDLYLECQDKISDERTTYFEGETEDYFVSFSSGNRESPYVLNGKSEQKVEFGVVTIKPKKSQNTKYLTYNVCVNNDEYIGEFEQSPYDDTYAGDINKKVFDDDTILIKINDGSKEQVANMTSVTKDFKIDSQNALKIALDEISSEYENIKTQNFEIYIKIVSDITRTISEKYYIVTFLSEDGKNLSVIINPKTGECEMKKL